MPIVFSAIVPHTPILIPSIGKENIARIELTQNSYIKLADEFLSSGAETIVIISPHGTVQTNVFTVNLNPSFKGGFEEFGDFASGKTWDGDIGLAYKIRESLETKAPLQLVSVGRLDYGAAVPLFLLTEKKPQTKIIPLYYSGLSNEAHFNFGRLLGHELLTSGKPIAVVASGDLSHRLSKDSPVGYSPKGKRFDKKVAEYLANKKDRELVNLDPGLIAEAGECGLRSIMILRGVLSEINCQPRLLSYEAPFGVGYLVVDYAF